MGLIKSNLAPLKLSTFSMADIEQQARGMLLRARQEADQILAAAKAEGETLKRQMAEKGHVEGKAAGLAQGREEGKNLGEAAAIAENKAKLTQLIAAISKAAGDLDASRRKLEAEARNEVVQLALDIARKVARTLGEAEPAVLQTNIADAMKLVVAQADIRIALNPGQKALFFDLLPKLKATWPTLEHAKIVEDETIAPGGCKIFTGGGEVDADLNHQIDRIAAELLGGNDGHPERSREGSGRDNTGS